MTDEELLDDVHRIILKYVAFQSEHYGAVVALWVLHTWVVNAFYVTPRLILDSAEPGSGKTRVLELLALLCRSAKVTLSTTTAALYRRLAAAQDEGLPPLTVLQDEADAIFGKNATPQSEDLRALFNAGYRKGATVDRCEGDAAKMRVREFPVHAPVGLAGLAGRMPDTITSRGVTLHMRRRRPDQLVADFRERDAQVEVAPIRDALEAWSEANYDVLAAARPKMPAGVTDRSAEIWEPLLAIADHAGPKWSAKARAACTFFVISSAGDDEKLSLGQRLLRDIQTLLEADSTNAMWSSDIISKLTSDPESEWRDLWGKSLDQRRLAKELSRYGVKSKTIRIGVATSKGYDLDGPTGLQQAWDHWLTPSVSGTSGTPDTSQVNAFRTVTPTTVTDTAVTAATQSFIAAEQHELCDVSDVPDVSPTDGVSPLAAPHLPALCSECQRAPSRRGTLLCDFCTVKRRRQQTDSESRATRETALDFAIRYIRDHSDADGEVPVSSAASAAEAAGHSWAALKRAASISSEIATRKAGRTWVWRLVADTEGVS